MAEKYGAEWFECDLCLLQDTKVSTRRTATSSEVIQAWYFRSHRGHRVGSQPAPKTTAATRFARRRCTGEMSLATALEAMRAWYFMSHRDRNMELNGLNVPAPRYFRRQATSFKAMRAWYFRSHNQRLMAENYGAEAWLKPGTPGPQRFVDKKSPL